MNRLNISVENSLVIGRYNGEGEGTVICGYLNDEQVKTIIDNHNKCEKLNPSKRNPLAILTTA